MKPVKSTLFNMIAAMLIVASGSAISIGYVYKITEQPIAESKNRKTMNAIAEVVGNFDNNPFDEKTELSNKPVELYPARENNTITSVAIKTSNNEGFGGKIELILGILTDGTITGYKIIEQNETPGLGTKVSENKFSKQFVGMNAYTDNFNLKKTAEKLML